MAIKSLDSNNGFLLINQTTDESSPTGYFSNGDRKGIHIFGNLDGATLQLQATTDSNEANFVDVKDSAGNSVTFTTTGIHVLDLFKVGMAYRCQLSGAGGLTDVSVKLV